MKRRGLDLVIQLALRVLALSWSETRATAAKLRLRTPARAVANSSDEFPQNPRKLISTQMISGRFYNSVKIRSCRSLSKNRIWPPLKLSGTLHLAFLLS